MRGSPASDRTVPPSPISVPDEPLTELEEEPPELPPEEAAPDELALDEPPVEELPSVKPTVSLVLHAGAASSEAAEPA
jgi:hypothetical protein